MLDLLWQRPRQRRPVEIPAAAVCRHVHRRDRRLAAGRHHHHDGDRGAAVHLRARSAGGACGDDRRLCRRIDRRPDRLLPARHSRARPSSIATTFDGFPMARNGEPGRAIWLGVWASVWGGLLGALFLVFLTGPLAAIALEFGPWEYFSLFVLAMAMVAGLTEVLAAQGTDLDRDRAADHGGRPRSDRQRAALHLRLGVHRRRLSVPAGADRHLRLRADHDRPREARTAAQQRDAVARRHQARALLAPQGESGRSSSSRSCCCGRRSSG